jgi:hypothetical protein
MSVTFGLLCVLLLAREPATDPAQKEEEAGDVAQEPEGGAGVSPIEIIPRIELRQSTLRLNNGLTVHDTTAEIDIQFVRRLVLRYQAPYRSITTPGGRVTGVGDTQVDALGIVQATPHLLFGLLAGGIIDTAAAPALGAGKYQISLGAAGAIKPRRFIITYVVATELFSVGGDEARPDVNRFAVRAGAILFGRQYNWLKLDLDGVADFIDDEARLLGTFEAGGLLIGRVGLFVRTGTQLLGQRELDWSLSAGFRYLFKLEQGRGRPPG